MNAETRAKEVADGMAKRLIDGGWVATVYPMIVKDWQNAIATALRQAENDKLEEAARVAENPGFIQARDTEWDMGVNYAKPFIANAIRALKKD